MTAQLSKSGANTYFSTRVKTFFHAGGFLSSIKHPLSSIAPGEKLRLSSGSNQNQSTVGRGEKSSQLGSMALLRYGRARWETVSVGLGLDWA